LVSEPPLASFSSGQILVRSWAPFTFLLLATRAPYKPTLELFMASFQGPMLLSYGSRFSPLSSTSVVGEARPVSILGRLALGECLPFPGRLPQEAQQVFR
jgi:hypothetical protein